MNRVLKAIVCVALMLSAATTLQASMYCTEVSGYGFCQGHCDFYNDTTGAWTGSVDYQC